MKLLAIRADGPASLTVQDDASFSVSYNVLQRTVLPRIDVDVGHALDRHSVEGRCPVAATARVKDCVSRFGVSFFDHLASGDRSDQDPFVDEDGVLAGHSIIVVAKAARAVGHRSIRSCRQLFRSIAKGSEIIQSHKGSARVRQLVAQDAIQFQRMADGLVGLQPHDRRQQDHAPFILRALVGHQYLIQLFDNPLRVLGKDLAIDGLPAPAQSPVPTQREFSLVRFSLIVPAENLEQSENIRNQLLDFAPFRVHKDDLLSNKGQFGNPLEHPRLVQSLIHLLHEGNLLGKGDLEGVDLARAGKLGLNRFLVCQAHRKGDPLGGSPCIVQGLVK